jgi:hypothetical protein
MSALISVLLSSLAPLAAHAGAHALTAVIKIAKAGVLAGADEAVKFAKDSRDAEAAVAAGDHAGAVKAILAQAAAHGKTLLLREVNLAIEIIVAEAEADIRESFPPSPSPAVTMQAAATGAPVVPGA